jgi:putative membrane protein
MERPPDASGARLTVIAEHAQKELRTMMGWYHDGMGWGGWLVMSLGMVAFWGLVLWAVVVLFRDTPPGDARPAHHGPQDTLDERFARGEIDEAEYRARAEVLRVAHH